MKNIIITLGVVAAALSGCSSATTEESDTVSETDNVLLQEWEGLYGGVPAFDEMQLSDLKPAMEREWSSTWRLLRPSPAILKNQILKIPSRPWKGAGKELDKAFTYYGIWSSNISSPEFRKIQMELSPKIAEHRSKILQNKELFERIKAVYEKSQQNPLSDDQQRVVQLIYEEFVMNGANLDAKEHYVVAELLSFFHFPAKKKNRMLRGIMILLLRWM